MANKKGESTDCSVYRTVRISRPIGRVGKEGKGRGKRKEERGRTDRRRGEGEGTGFHISSYFSHFTPA